MAKLVTKFQGEDIKINFKYRDKSLNSLINIDTIDDVIILLYSSDGEIAKQFRKTASTGSFAELTGSYTQLTRVDPYQYYGWIESAESANIPAGIIKSETKFLTANGELDQFTQDTIAVSDIFELREVKAIKYAN